MSSAELQSPLARPIAGTRAYRNVPTWLRALLFYLLLAILTIGIHAIGHLQSVCACYGNSDAAQYMWAMSWWPHALLHGLNPFVSHYLWSPTGVDLAKAATIPTAAMLMAPVTALFGPILSYNIVAIASPALCAFTAYMVCRRVVKRELPALTGGLLFGFSSYEFGQLLGHLNLFAAFLLPVIVLVTLRRLDRELSRFAFVLIMAALLVLQLGLSTELLGEYVMLGAVLLVAARYLADPRRRARIDRLIVEILAAGLIAIVVASPFLYYALISGGFPSGNPTYSDTYGLDLANLIFPTITTWLGHHDFQSLWSTFEGGDVSETNGYLGCAILIAFTVWFFGASRRTTLGRLLVIVVVLSVLMALGAHLHVAGHQTIPLPYNWIKTLPFFDKLVPSRLMLYASLATAVGVAAWLARPDGNVRARWALVLLGVVMLIPNVESSLYGVRPVNPRFFSTDAYRRYIAPNATVLVLPFGIHDVSTLWQAETDFYFYMPEGYVSTEVPAAFTSEPGVAEFLAETPPAPATLSSFMQAHRVSDVVVDPTTGASWPATLAAAGLHAQKVGGILLYAVPGAPR